LKVILKLLPRPLTPRISSLTPATEKNTVALPLPMLRDRPLSSVNYVTPPHSPLPSQSLPLEHDPLSPFSSAPSPDQGNSHSPSLAPIPIGQDYDNEGATRAESTAFLQQSKDSDAVPSQRGRLVTTTPFRRRPLLWALALTVLVAVILAVIFPLYFTVIRRNGHGGKSSIATDSPGSGSGSGSGSGNSSPASSTSATSGGDGSKIISGNISFTYSNPFGGYCEFVVAYLNPLKICENLLRARLALKFLLQTRAVPFEFFCSLRPFAVPQGHRVVTSRGFTVSVPRELCNETGTNIYRFPSLQNFPII
jgi:hypothetical protein